MTSSAGIPWPGGRDLSKDNEPTVDLDARGLRAHVERTDDDSDDLALVIEDGDVAVRITTGAGGAAIDAVGGFERLAVAALQAAELVRRRALGRDTSRLFPLNGPGMRP
jgi:hypothetical protein